MTRLGALVACLVVGLAAFPADAESPRSMLYPRPRTGVRFEHARHAKIACLRCHASVVRSVSAADRNLPLEEVCQPCHAKETRPLSGGRPQHALAGCTTCHVGYRGGPTAPPQEPHPEARVHFSHRLHGERGVGCESCHPLQQGSPTLPSMSTCLACHEKTRAPSRCGSCHLTTKEGLLRTRFGSEILLPRGTLRADAHDAGFRRQHAAQARRAPSYCASCHASEQCLRCHNGTLRPLELHRGDYASFHAQDARRDQPRCASCHRSQTFCLGCHQRSGVASSAGGGFKPSTGLVFHPPGFSSVVPGPTHHAHAARRNLRTCTSCHTEESCIRCHGSRGVGKGGFSPHGPGFVRSPTCRMLAARNVRVCLRCHAGSDPKLTCQ